MSAEPLPLLHKRTPPPPAVTSFLPVDVPALPPSESLMAAAGIEVDAAWFDDEVDAALEADRVSTIAPVGATGATGRDGRIGLLRSVLER